VHATLVPILPMEVSPSTRFRPLRRVEYDKLIELGAFHDEHIELLDGVLVPMSPIGPPHSSSVQKLNELLLPTLLGRATVRIQSPFAALELSEPEPDVAVVPLGDYQRSHPDQAHLIIEVAESSLSVHRGIKQRLYAACSVPEYWIVNIAERCIEVYREPAAGAYAKLDRYERENTLRPLRFPDLEIRVADVVR
jgi:Uma2 family endonuclease